MSLITRCPVCETMFKVVDDQFKVAQGWVRCGYCGEVFDAALHLVPADAAAAGQPAPPGGRDAPAALRPESDAQSPPSSSPPPGGADALPAASGQGEGVRKRSVEDTAERLQQGFEPTVQDELVQDELVQDELVQDGKPVPALDPADPASPAASLTDADARKEPVLMRDREETHAADAASAQAGEPAAAGPEKSPDSNFSTPAEPAPEVSFVRDARRRAFWEKPLVRGFLGLLALALLAALLLQWVLQQKDHLAARNPQLTPFLQALCEPLNCRIRPPRQIESLVIDSSSFSKVAPDVYRLSFVLKNNGPAVLEIPSVEVSLTDLQEQALVRRVLAPQEFGAGAGALAAHAELAAVLILQVSGESAAGAPGAPGAPASAAAPLPITGYRILAFYP